MEYDDILKKTGEFGVYQKRIYFLVCMIGFPAAFNGLGYVFWAARPQHWCHVNKPAEFSNVTDADWKNLTIPLLHSEQDNKKVAYETCVRYDIDHLLALNESYRVVHDESPGISNGHLNGSEADNGTVPCDSWDYDRTQYMSSIVTEYDLVCGRQWLISVSQSLYMACRVVGTLGLAAVADRFGRRKVILVSIFFQVFSAIATAFAPGIYTFIAFRNVCAIFSTGSFQTIYVLVMELVGPNWRVFAGTGIMVYWALGYILLALIAYFIRDHFILQLVISVPFVLLFTFYWIIPESPRWLLLKGKKEEVVKIITHMAEVNGRKLDDIDMLLPGDIKATQHNTPWYDTIRHLYIWKMTAVLFLIWFANAVVYYGLSLNSSNLGGNDYFNFFINGAVEIPAYFLCYISFWRYGRQLPLLSMMILAGMSLLATAFTSPDQYIAVVILATIGKFSITCTYSMIYIYTTELFPTAVRNISLGMCNTVSRIGGALAPFAAEMNQYYPGLPLIIFGILASASGIVVLTLPETKGKPLPQTLQDGKYLADQPNIITKCCKSKRNSKDNEGSEKEETQL